MKAHARSGYCPGVFDELPPKEGAWLRTLGGLILAVVIAGFLFPAVSIHSGGGDRKSETKTVISHLTSSLKAYYTEYGKWPDFTGDGLFLDEKRQAQLIRMLCAKDETNNPRRIVFIEGKTAVKTSDSTRPYHSGINRESGAYFDPRGNLYRIVIDSDYDGEIANPYTDDPYKVIRLPVLVWSLGKDGKQGAPSNPRTSKGSDDILSWQ